MGNIFLHEMQMTDSLRESVGSWATKLWNREPIEAFMVVTQSWADRNPSMHSSFASLFCKTARCPASQALLAHHRAVPSFDDHDYIESHLASCDFCSAELQLLRRYCGEAEEYSFAEMPAALRRLAEDLMTRSTEPFRGFAQLRENRQLLH
jgi:N-acyl-D-aspartate/D-glutamate deacylase